MIDRNFEDLLSDPYGQWDVNGELLPHLLAFGPASYTAETQLCGADGIVRSGAMHHGRDYRCTGSAHFDGAHIRCTSPAHGKAAD